MSRGFAHSGSRKSGQLGMKRPVPVAVPDTPADDAIPEAQPPAPPGSPQRPALQLLALALAPAVDAFPPPELDIALAFDWSMPDIAVDGGQFNPVEFDDFEFTALPRFDDWLTTY